MTSSTVTNSTRLEKGQNPLPSWKRTAKKGRLFSKDKIRLMERRVTGNCHARCEAGEKREITSNSYLSLYEVRSYVGWYRHLTLVMLALAFLTSIALAARRSAAPLLSALPPATEALISPALCPLSVPEARRLLARL